jgi:hypothetical protein
MPNLWYRNCPAKPKTHLCSNTAKRFSCVLGMLSSLEVKVLRPT